MVFFSSDFLIDVLDDELIVGKHGEVVHVLVSDEGCKIRVCASLLAKVLLQCAGYPLWWLGLASG